MTIIAFVGLIGSGKDTAAAALIEKHGFVRCSFASSLKDACANIFHWDRTMLEGQTPESREWREQVDEWWAERLSIPHFTPRWALQHIGTNILRDTFHKDIWVLSLQRSLLDTNQNVVISDARFQNEIIALRNIGATIVEVRRRGKPEWWPIAIEASLGNTTAISRIEEIGIHKSEWDWACIEPDAVIDNSGTIEDLYKQVEYLFNR